MNTTGIVYRPPFEANSLLLQVTTGCSHNKCTFCYMYHDVPFTMCPLEQVEADLDEAALFRPDVKRVFLEHGDPFTMPAERLLKIAELIHQKLPKVETIAMYASIQNIRRKTDAELRRLRDAGINGLDIGVESGLDEALTMMNKGHTAQESIEQLQRLKKAVTVLSIMVTWSLENAIETADSMRCRGYGLPGRTAFSIYRLDSRDKLALGWLLLCGLYLCGGWAAGQFAWRYYPTIKGAVGLLPFSFQAVYLALSFTPVFLDLREDAKWKRLASEI